MGTVSDISQAPSWDGSSNSHPNVTNCRFSTHIGVDTVSWCWRGSDPVDRLLRLDGLVVGEDHRPLRVVPAPGRSVRLSRRLDGLGTVGAFPGAPLLYVEGRAAALHERDEDNHALAAPRVLPEVEERVCRELSALLGADLDCVGAIRRVDLSGEFRFHRGEDGQQLLRVLDGLHSPHYKTSPVRERGGPGLQTAYWRTPTRSVPVLRAYDKGIESGTAAPGERIRLERQLRYTSSRRPTLSQWLTNDLGDVYAQPIRQWLAGGVAAGTAAQLIRLLTDAAVIWPSYWASGRSWCSKGGREWRSLWSARKVERILGTLTVVDAYGAHWPAWGDRQRQRRMAEIRDHGLLLLDQPVHIDAHALVEGLCTEWRQAA